MPRRINGPFRAILACPPVYSLFHAVPPFHEEGGLAFIAAGDGGISGHRFLRMRDLWSRGGEIGRFCGTDGRFRGTDGAAVGADERPIGADGRPIGADERLIGADERPMGADGRLIRADGALLERVNLPVPLFLASRAVASVCDRRCRKSRCFRSLPMAPAVIDRRYRHLMRVIAASSGTAVGSPA